MSAEIVPDTTGIEPVPGAAKPDPVLTVTDVRKSFGGVIAVDVERLEVQRGSITAMIGPNGAGKTTLFNVLTGFERANHGTWSFDGRPIHELSAHRVARLGMVRTFQLTRALARMSVLDNMRLAATGQRGERFWSALTRSRWQAQETEVTERARELLDRVDLADKADDYAGTLSGGQRKLLELARALMVDPQLVMLDEPTAGVNPVLVESLLGHITALRDEGRTVVFVEHDMDVVQTISDWVVVLAEGAVIAEGRHGDCIANPAVIDAYLGTRFAERERAASGDGRSGDLT
ncbi:MAG TPA: ABC transporter ATP-binding protein [Acidimicrobiales bacterium]|nr:ABC transporter ATP-binding protein [Acidimicrobiales bacterium]